VRGGGGREEKGGGVEKERKLDKGRRER